MSLISKDKSFRPAGWQKHYLEFANSEIPYIRQLALETVPTPLPEGFIVEISRLLKDPDVDVQIAACQLAGKEKNPVFKKDLLSVLASANERWLVGAATNSLSQLDRVECLNTLAAKFDAPELTQDVLSYFIPLIINVQGWGSRTGTTGAAEDPASEGKRMKALWLKFISDNSSFLKNGGFIKPDDPRITAYYFPHNMCLNINGKDWPPLAGKKTH